MSFANATTELNEKLITSVVHEFYSKIRADDMLSPVFAVKIKPDDWDAHLARMVDFWSSVLLGTGRYSGRPHALHQPLPIDRTHFVQWLTLFDETVTSLCPPDIATVFMGRAMQIAASLQSGMGIYPYAEYMPQKRGIL